MKILKIKILFTIVIIFLVFDLLFTHMLSYKINLYDKFYPNLDHRIWDQYYHHSFAENVDTIDTWGPYKYKFLTNSLGFKDEKNYKINLNEYSGRRIILIGDSFTEGIGFEYKETFAGILSKKLKKFNIQILNAGIASQSPIIYLSKILYMCPERLYIHPKDYIFV